MSDATSNTVPGHNSAGLGQDYFSECARRVLNGTAPAAWDRDLDPEVRRVIRGLVFFETRRRLDAAGLPDTDDPRPAEVDPALKDAVQDELPGQLHSLVESLIDDLRQQFPAVSRVEIMRVICRCWWTPTIRGPGWNA